MELVAIENSRVIYLTQVHRPSGQLYLPEAAAKLVQRYSFVQHPSLEELMKEVVTFGTGKFQDIQIQELKIYTDGVIVSSRSNTKQIDVFLADLFEWLRSELGVIEVVTAKGETHYESLLVVKSNADMEAALKPAKEALEAFNQIWRKGYGMPDLKLSSFHLDTDPDDMLGRKRPMFFGVERRVGHAYNENVFFSVAPLKTDDHLDVLRRLEDLAARR